jgi:hypothetical protein
MLISLASRVTWTWLYTSSTSTTHSLPQCVLCTINISREIVIIPSFHLPTSFFHIISQKHDFLRFYWARVKSRKSSLFLPAFWWNGNVQIATVWSVKEAIQDSKFLIFKVILLISKFSWKFCKLLLFNNIKCPI